MRNIIIILICFALAAIAMFAQEKIYIHKTDNSVVDMNVSEIDSMAFRNNNQHLYIYKTDNTYTDMLVSEIDSLTFEEENVYADAVVITYSGGAASVLNPYSDAGITVTQEGADVVVNASGMTTEIKYVLSGTTEAGSFKIYSDYKFELVMNGVDITSIMGPAVNIQSGKKVSVTLAGNTVNKLTDSSNYDETSEEDMKATLFSEGQLVFDGEGSLFVQGNYKHGICSDDYIRFNGGNTTVTGSVKDGIHCNDYFRMDGGTLNVTSTSDGIECEEGYIQINGGDIEINSGDDGINASYKKTGDIVSTVEIIGGNTKITTNNQKGAGIKSKLSSITISGGTLDISVLGIASKALSSGTDMTITGGDITLKTSGNAYYDTDDADTSSAAGIKCDGNFLFEKGTLNITSSGSGGKGINVDGTLTINDGEVNVTTTGDQYVYDSNNDTAAKAIKSDGNLTVNGGAITIKTSKTEAEGLESKATLVINGGTIEIEAYDDCINASNHIEINGGYVYANSTANDAIDSNGTLTITGGTVVAVGSGSPEAGFDCDNSTFKITGGTIIGIGGSTSTPTSNVSTQRSVIYSARTTSQIFYVEDAEGKSVLAFKSPKTFSQSMTILFSNANIKSGTKYTIYTGGSISGGSDFHGLYTDETYTKGTQATSFTSSTTSMVTTVGSSGGSGRP